MELIKRAVSNFPWEQHFIKNPDINWQVESFTKIVLNIMSNFIPNEIKLINSRDPPWLSKPLRIMLNKQKRLYKNFKRHGYKAEDKTRVDSFSEECKKAITVAKNAFINKSGSALADPNTSRKTYWKIINRLLNKSKTPRIPPILQTANLLYIAKIKPYYLPISFLSNALLTIVYYLFSVSLLILGSLHLT